MSDMEGVDDMPGMMSPDQMKALADAPDGEFRSLWLEMMIEHHEGAIEMARTEIEDGAYAAALSMAESIVGPSRRRSMRWRRCSRLRFIPPRGT